MLTKVKFNFNNRLTEKQIENSILSYLQFKKIFCWKQNTVGIYDKEKGVFRRPHSPYIIKGVSDIIGIFKNRLLAIEIKTPERRKNVTLDQQAFIDKVNEMGGIAFVATSINDVNKQLDLI